MTEEGAPVARRWDALPDRAAKIHAIAVLTAAGLSTRQVAAHLGIAQSHIFYYKKATEFPEWGRHADTVLSLDQGTNSDRRSSDKTVSKKAGGHQQPLTEEAKFKIAEALTHDVNIAEVARVLGHSWPTVRKVADDLGIMRPGQGYALDRPAGTPTKAVREIEAAKVRKRAARVASQEKAPLDLGSLPPGYVVGSHRNFIDRLTEYLRTMRMLGGRREVLLRWTPVQIDIYLDALDRLSRTLADWHEDLRSERLRLEQPTVDTPDGGAHAG